jgi:thioredoxin reductase (NADPH)
MTTSSSSGMGGGATTSSGGGTGGTGGTGGIRVDGAAFPEKVVLQSLVDTGGVPLAQFDVVNHVPLEQYLPGVLDRELYRAWHPTAFRAQAERFGTQVVDADVERVDLSARPFRLWARGAEYRAQTVIVATGASAMWLGLDSETRLRGRGVSACATCDGFFFKDREIAVVGGGDTAFEEASYLTRFASKVHLLHRRDEFRASRIMVERARENPRIEIHTNTGIEEVLGDAKVEALRLRDTATGAEREMPIGGLFIAIGHKPNTEAFRDWLEVDAKGYLVAHDETHSRIEGVFIAGDVHDHRYRQAITAAGDGCKAAIDAERWLEAQGITEANTLTAW